MFGKALNAFPELMTKISTQVKTVNFENFLRASVLQNAFGWVVLDNDILNPISFNLIFSGGLAVKLVSLKTSWITRTDR